MIVKNTTTERDFEMRKLAIIAIISLLFLSACGQGGATLQKGDLAGAVASLEKAANDFPDMAWNIESDYGKFKYRIHMDLDLPHTMGNEDIRKVVSSFDKARDTINKENNAASYRFYLSYIFYIPNVANNDNLYQKLIGFEAAAKQELGDRYLENMIYVENPDPDHYSLVYIVRTQVMNKEFHTAEEYNTLFEKMKLSVPGYEVK